MDNKDLITHLVKLAQLDIDAIRAYEQAISKIENTDVETHLMQFCDDHRKHVQELSSEIKSLGGTPPENKPDIKGYLIEGFTALMGITGTKGALKAMKSNEKLTNSTYEKALKEEGIPVKIRDLLERNLQDERRHLSYIENALTQVDELDEV